MPPQKNRAPNILFLIMDDVGVDQMTSFGYGGTNPAPMPNMNEIAHKGVRFRNNWSAPACSPSRAMFFQGRFPARSNVLNAIGTADLANSMVSPYDVTAPKLMKKRGYQSGLFGKFHLATPGNDPYGEAMVSALGWDYYAGFSDATGDPQSIDSTAGGAGARTAMEKIHVRFCSGRKPYGRCRHRRVLFRRWHVCGADLCDPAASPGRMCLEGGGIFIPNESCTSPVPSKVDFSS